MFLEKIEVRNYRSISALTLTPCGDFNVLIGRNSSGKSNILTTIDAFFASIKRGWINLAPPLGDEIDFFQKRINNEISIGATFSLSSEERERLFVEVSEERPQVRNLLESISGDLHVVIEICFRAAARKYCYVRSVNLLAGSASDIHKLYEVGEQAASELYDIAKKAEQAESAKQSLDRFIRLFDADDFSRLKRTRYQPELGGLRSIIILDKQGRKYLVVFERK